MKQSTWTLSVLTLVLGAGWATGQKQPMPPQGKSSGKTPAVAPKSEQPPKGFAQFEMEEGDVNEQTGISAGRNFTYREKDTVITGDKVQFNNKTDRLIAEGDLIMDDSKHHVIGDKANVDTSAKKIAIITGNVVINLKPKAEPTAPQPNNAVPLAPVEPPQEAGKPKENETVASARGKGVTIFCDKVESYYSSKKKYVKIFGKTVKFTQKIVKKDGTEVERTVIAEHAEYSGLTDKLQLFAPVKATDTDGQEFNFSGDVWIDTKEGAEAMKSKEKFKGIIRVKEEEDEDKDAGKTPPR